MRLGIDLDGVVADFSTGWMQLHADEFGSVLRPEMVDAWDCLHRLGGFADMREFWAWAAPKEHRRSILRHLEPYPRVGRIFWKSSRTAISGAIRRRIVAGRSVEIGDAAKYALDTGGMS